MGCRGGVKKGLAPGGLEPPTPQEAKNEQIFVSKALQMSHDGFLLERHKRKGKGF